MHISIEALPVSRFPGGQVVAMFSFKCRSCSQIHEGSPCFGFDSPWYYSDLSPEEEEEATLTSDTCVIPTDNGADWFVRGLLAVPIIGGDSPFLWDLWVSLSESGFRHYQETRDNPDESASHAGWLCNRLPYYEDTLRLKILVRPRTGGRRPLLELELSEHELAQHWRRGITVSQAQEIAEQASRDT